MDKQRVTNRSLLRGLSRTQIRILLYLKGYAPLSVSPGILSYELERKDKRWAEYFCSALLNRRMILEDGLGHYKLTSYGFQAIDNWEQAQQERRQKQA